MVDDDTKPKDGSQDPSLLDQAVTYVQDRWNEGQERNHNAMEQARQGNYAPLQQMSIDTAMSTVGSTAVPPGMNGYAAAAPGVIERVGAKLGMPATATAEEVANAANQAYQAGKLSAQQLGQVTNVANGVKPIKGYADGGEVADSPEQIAQDAAAQAPGPAQMPAQVPQKPASSGNPDLHQDSTELYDISGKQPVLGSVPHDQVTAAVQSGKFSFPKGTPVSVVNPDGELGEIPPEQAPQAFQNGYRFATPADERHHEFGSATEMGKTALEGAAEGIAGPLATAAEVGLGISTPERIRARAEENPITKAVTETAAFGASMLSGVGVAALVGKAGQAVVEGAGLANAASTVAKIGSHAAQMAAETALIQSGHEVSKMIVQDPSQSVGTAITDIGLSALIGGAMGGAVGTAGPLWDAAMGSKTGQILKRFADRAGGIEGAVPDAVNDAVERAGINMPPEVRAGLSEDPYIANMFKTLEQSDTTKAGVELQESLKKFKQEGANAIASALGKTPEDLASLANMSEFEIGKGIQKTLVSSLKESMDPIAEQFDKVSKQFKGVEIPDARKSEIAETIAKVSQEKGYTLSPSAPGSKIVNDVMAELPGIKNLEQLRQYQSIIGEKTTEKQLWGLGKDLRNIFREAEEKLLDESIAGKMAARELPAGLDPLAEVEARQQMVNEGENLLNQHKQARAAYREQMNLIDELNDRLRVGRFNGPKSFISALNDMSPEDILKRLSPKGDTSLLNDLQAKFPQVAEQLKDYHLGQVLETSVKRAGPGEALNVKALSAQLEKLSPEMRQWLVPQGAKTKIDAVQQLLEGFDRLPHNHSNTARTIDKLLGDVPGSVLSLISMIAGHNPLGSALLGPLTKFVSKDAPDAVRMATLKFLGSNAPIEPGAFKSAVDFIQSTIKGENLIKSSVSKVFKSGAEVLPTHVIPKDRDRDKLDKVVKSAMQNPTDLLNAGGKTGHYMPQQGTAMAQTAGTAAQYLDSIKPKQVKANPLDSALPVPAPQKAEYDRQLDIAQQPLMVLKHIKEGTIQPNDIKTLTTIYPAMYQKLSQQLMDHVISHSAKDESIPYKTRIGLSIFLGQPLDSTMTAASILAAQPKPPANQGPQAQGQPGKAPPASSMKGLSKMPSEYQTALQKAQSRQESR